MGEIYSLWKSVGGARVHVVDVNAPFAAHKCGRHQSNEVSG